MARAATGQLATVARASGGRLSNLFRPQGQQKACKENGRFQERPVPPHFASRSTRRGRQITTFSRPPSPRRVRSVCSATSCTIPAAGCPEALTLPMRGVDLAGHCGERIKGIPSTGTHRGVTGQASRSDTPSGGDHRGVDCDSSVSRGRTWPVAGYAGGAGVS